MVINVRTLPELKLVTIADWLVFNDVVLSKTIGTRVVWSLGLCIGCVAVDGTAICVVNKLVNRRWRWRRCRSWGGLCWNNVDVIANPHKVSGVTANVSRIRGISLHSNKEECRNRLVSRGYLTTGKLKIELTTIVSYGIAVSIESIGEIIISSRELRISTCGDQRSGYTKWSKTRTSGSVVGIRTSVSNGLTNANNNLAILTRNRSLVARTLRVVCKNPGCIGITVSRENRNLYTWRRCINRICKCKFRCRNCKNCNKRKCKCTRNSLKRLDVAHKTSWNYYK